MQLNSPITFTYLALLSWFYFVISAFVIKKRVSYRVSLGTGTQEHKGLEKLVRAHGNFSEYVLFGIVLLFACEQLGASTNYLHSLGLALIIGRVCHYIGMVYLKAPNLMRITGMTLTFYILITAPFAIFYLK